MAMLRNIVLVKRMLFSCADYDVQSQGVNG